MSNKNKSYTIRVEDIDSWEYPIIKLLYSFPRIYQPLIDSLEVVHPGLSKYLSKLKKLGFLDYQKGIIYNSRTDKKVDRKNKPQMRFRLTNKGKSFLLDIKNDSRILTDHYPKIKERNINNIINFLSILNLDDNISNQGLSLSYISKKLNIPIKNVRYWTDIFSKKGYIKLLPNKISDVREIIPAHYRVNKKFTKHLKHIINNLDNGEIYKKELKLDRKKYLLNINPSRIGITGATDYDHDIEVQKVLSKFILSPNIINPMNISAEPKFKIKIDKLNGKIVCVDNSSKYLYYQPDALFNERIDEMKYYSILEFERFQNRRDGWLHIEKFLAYIHQNIYIFEGSIIRFVVSSEKRLKSYVDLLEGFAHYISENQIQAPNNKIILSVTSFDRINNSINSLDSNNWFWIEINADKSDKKEIIIHDENNTPYKSYFGKQK
jgi:hypothetical protein